MDKPTLDEVFHAAQQLSIADQQRLVILLAPPKTIEQLAAEQGVGPFNFKAAQAEATFWPEDESADNFIAFLRESRSDGARVRETGRISEVDEYWTRRVEIGRLPQQSEGDQDVSLIWHQAREKCGRGHRELALGVMKDDTERVYVHAKACYFVPNIVITLAVTAPNAAPGEQVGMVEDVASRGSRRVEIGNLQAWFYPDAGALMLWETDIWRHPEADPRNDFILACLFDGFERELLRVFPDAREVITPHEPNYPNKQWAAFLAERGYAPHIENTYRKALSG